MTYTEWRDELKSNLLSVSESERRRVLDYYAEAYADRRDAGFTEREIIEDFGAPYDAAQRILSESGDYYEAPPSDGARRREEREKEERIRREERERIERERRTQNPPPPPPAPSQPTQPAAQTAKQRGDYTWVFVLLCIIFAVPIFMVVMTMVGITVGFCVAPFGVLISGVISIGAGIGGLFSDATAGAVSIGTGLILFGASLIMMPLFFKLVKWMWKLFNMFFAWLKRLFSGKKV